MPRRILGIETSCDETAAAVVEDGERILSNVIRTQVEIHDDYGGVVPEIASREHVRTLLPVIEAALERSDTRPEDLAAVAVTQTPGLVGSLLVGLSTAKGAAIALGLPLLAVDHLEAHVYAARLADPSLDYPYLCLLASGGHTSLVWAEGPRRMRTVGETVDDAAGEAFDKVAAMLGLSLPGGPAVQRVAEAGDPKRSPFPRPRVKRGAHRFSFSGLKTAVLYHVRGQDALAPTPAPADIPDRADIAASFEAAAVDTLVTQTLRAARDQKLERIVVAGGVACNRHLRERMCTAAEEAGMKATFPSPAYCSDNAAMIAGLGYHVLEREGAASHDLDALAR